MIESGKLVSKRERVIQPVLEAVRKGGPGSGVYERHSQYSADNPHAKDLEHIQALQSSSASPHHKEALADMHAKTTEYAKGWETSKAVADKAKAEASAKALAERGPKTHGIAALSSRSKLDTQNPMANEYVKGWHESDTAHPEYGKTTYHRVETSNGDSYIIAGHADAKPGDHFHIKDDGNGTTRFGAYGGMGTMTKVTHTGTIDDLKNFPKSKQTMYVMK